MARIIIGTNSKRKLEDKKTLVDFLQKSGIFLNVDFVEDEDVSEIVYFFQRETHDLPNVSNERILPERLKEAYFLCSESTKGKAKWDRVYICKSGNIYLVGCDYSE